MRSGRCLRVMADMPARRLGHQLEKLAATHMNQCLMIARLEIDVWCIDQALVENGVDAVCEPHGRQGARFAVLEELDQLPIRREAELAIELSMHGAKVHLVAGRYHCHEVALVVFQHDALGKSITGNVSGLRSVVAVPSALVRDHVIVHAFAGQTVLYGCCNSHDYLLSSFPREPILASAVSRFDEALRDFESHRLLGSSGGTASAMGAGSFPNLRPRPRFYAPSPSATCHGGPRPAFAHCALRSLDTRIQNT